MKKVLVFVLIFVFICVGCSMDMTSTSSNKEENKSEKEKKVYVDYVKKLKDVKETTENLPFDITITFDKINEEEIRYQVVIDNPKSDIKNIEAIAVHDKQTDDVFPSIGIFDDTIDLITNQKPEGVILVGYIPYEEDLEDFECEVKVLIKYEIENNEYKGYYVTKK